ncbi:hypothetical protein Pst134EB_026175 [Puccinia striiformis f. sp. tritici]|nr:hypothetical protein Pst134EB_026175 [Puccinia striiformis f. sp. tritici]
MVELLESPHWTPGPQLTKAHIGDILKKHNVPSKGRDKKEVLVQIYNRFIKSEGQVTSSSKSTAVPSTTLNSSTHLVSPSCEFAD